MGAILSVLILVAIFATPFIVGTLASDGKNGGALLAGAPLCALALYLAIFEDFLNESAWGIYFAIPVWASALGSLVAFAIGLRRHRSNLRHNEFGE